MRYRLRKTYTTDPEKALEEILLDRGVEDINAFQNPNFSCELNPYDLENIEQGANLLLKHLWDNNNILIIQDCDVDGICSASIIWLYCKKIFPNCNLEFRVHEHKEHGLSDLIDWIEEKDKWKLVIVPDAGSYDVDYHKRLYEIGVDCLVIDHHAQMYDENNQPIISDFPNTVIINNQLSPRYKNKSLCGAGMVYKFCEVLDDMLEKQYAPDFLDLAALGEIADVMDRTTSETNYIMIQGLKQIKNQGFQTLLQAQSFSLKDRGIPPYIGLTPIDIAFYIAPLLNAIIRVGSLQDKLAAFYCFIEPDRPLQSTKRGAKEGDIELAAEQAARVGKNAKSRQDNIKEKAFNLIDTRIKKEGLDHNNILIIEVNNSDNIPQEMSGLVAMGIVSKYNKPCLIVRRNSQNLLQGSARGSSNFSSLPSLKDYLEQSGYFEYAAGHDNALGVGFKASNMDSFLDYVNANLSAKDFENVYLVDYVLDARNDNQELLKVLASHPEYFGNHIDEIKVVIKNINLSNIFVMGANKDSIKISDNNVDYVRFKDADFIEEVLNNKDKTLTVYGRINLNTYGGRTTVQVFCDDYQFEERNDKYDF